MMWKGEATSDNQTDSKKKRRRSSAGLGTDNNKRKKVSPSMLNNNMAANKSKSQTRHQSNESYIDHQRDSQLGCSSSSQPELREVIVDLMDTLKQVYGEDIVSSFEEKHAKLQTGDKQPGVQTGSISTENAKGVTVEDCLLGEIIEKAQMITAGLMENLHSNVSNNNRLPRHVKYMQSDPDTQSNSTISSISFDYAIRSDSAGKEGNPTAAEVPVNNGPMIEPSTSYMDMNNNIACTSTETVKEETCLPCNSASAEVAQQMSDMDINQTRKLGFFKELLNLLTEDGGCSELSSDDLSYLSSLMTQREKRGQENEAHNHRQAQAPHITSRCQGDKEWSKVNENCSSKSFPPQGGLPKLPTTGKLFPHRSSLSMLTPKQKPSIPPTHRGNFILAGKPAEDRGNSYWRQFRSPEPLREQPKPTDVNQSKRSFAEEYISNTLPQIIGAKQETTHWPKQVSKDSLVNNKIYEYYYKLGPGTKRPCENPTLKIKDINFGDNSSKKELCESNGLQLKTDAKSSLSDQSSSNLSSQRQEPCPSLASSFLHKSNMPTTSSYGDSIKRANKKIETAKEAVLNSLYKSQSVVQMNKQKFWHQSYPLLHGKGPSMYTRENQEDTRCSVYQLGSLKSPHISKREERGADSRLSGPLMGKILEGYDQSCGTTRAESVQPLSDSRHRDLQPMSLSDSFRRDLAKKYGKNGINMSSIAGRTGGTGIDQKDFKSPELVHDRLSIGSSFLKEDNNKLRRENALSKQRQIEERLRKQEILKLRFGKDKKANEKLYKPVYKLSDRDAHSESNFEYRRVSHAEVRNIDSRAISPKTDDSQRPSNLAKEKETVLVTDEKVQEIKVKVRHIKKKSSSGEKPDSKNAVLTKSTDSKPKSEKGDLRGNNKKESQRSEAERISSETQLNRNSNNQYSFPSSTQNGFVKSDDTLNTQRPGHSCWLSGNRHPHYQSDTYLQNPLQNHSDGRRYLPTPAEILYFTDRSHHICHQHNIMTRQSAGANYQYGSGCDAMSNLWNQASKLQSNSEPETNQVEESSKTLQQQFDLVGQVLQESRKQITVENNRSTNSSSSAVRSDTKKVPSAKSNEFVKPVDVKVPQWKNEKFYKEWMLQKELAKFSKIPIEKINKTESVNNGSDEQSSSFTDTKLYSKTYDANKYSPQNLSNHLGGGTNADHEQENSGDGRNKRKVYPKDSYVNPSVESKVHVTEMLKKMLVQKVYEEHTGKEYPSNVEYSEKSSDMNRKQASRDSHSKQQIGSNIEEKKENANSLKKLVHVVDEDQCYRPGKSEPTDSSKILSEREVIEKSEKTEIQDHSRFKSILKNNVEYQPKVKTEADVKPESEELKLNGSDCSDRSDFTVGSATRHTTSLVGNRSVKTKGNNLLRCPGTSETVAYKSYGDSSDKNKSNYYHSNSRSSKVKESKYTHIKTAEKKSSAKKGKEQREAELVKKDNSLNRENELQKSSHHGETVSESHNKKNENTDTNTRKKDKSDDQVPSKHHNKEDRISPEKRTILDELELESFCQLSDISSHFSDSDWSLNSHRSFITQMFDDEDSDDEELLKPAFNNAETDEHKNEMSEKVPQNERYTKRSAHISNDNSNPESYTKTSENTKQKSTQSKQTNFDSHSKERIKSSSTKHVHKSDKERKVEAKLKKRKSGKKLDNLNKVQNIKKSSSNDKEKVKSSAGQESSTKEQLDRNEHTGVQSFKDYLQNKAKSKKNVAQSAGPTSGTPGSEDTDNCYNKSPQDVFKSIWLRTRGHESPYIVSPWKPKKESGKMKGKKVFDKKAYSYLLDPSMGECTTAENTLNDFWSDGPDRCNIEHEGNSEDELLGYEGQCIVSVSSPGHDDVHITITLPVARKQHSSRKPSASHGNRKHKTKRNSVEKATMDVKTKDSDLSSTENSDSVLVKNMDYPLEVRKNWSAAKERPKEVIEHDSYQNFTTLERHTGQVEDTNTSNLYSSDSSEADTQHSTDSHKVRRKRTDKEVRTIQALAKEQAKIYSIIKKNSSRAPGLFMTERQSSRGCASIKRLEPEGCTSSEDSTAETSSNRCFSDSSTGATIDSRENPRAALRDVIDSSDGESLRMTSRKDQNSPKRVPADSMQSWLNTSHGKNSGIKYSDEVEYSVRHFQTQRCYDKVTLESQCGYINLHQLKTWLPYVEDNGFLYVPVREITSLFNECVGRCNIRKSVLLKDGELDVRMCSHHQANLFGNIWPIGKQSTNIHSGDMMVRWDRFGQHYRRLRKKIIEQHRNTTKKWSRECLYNMKP